MLLVFSVIQQEQNEVVNAEYTLAEGVFFMDEKQEPPGMGLRRPSAKLYGAFSRRMHKTRIWQKRSDINHD